MPDAPKVSFNIVNLSFTVAQQVLGISCVEGITVRGPFASPNFLIGSWSQFVNMYGGYSSTSDFPLLCKRAFDGGAQLRVNRVGHYSTITTKSTLDATKATASKITRINFSAALITLNKYDLTVNAVPMAQVTFASSSDATMAAIVVALQAANLSPYIKAVWADTGASIRNIYITPQNGVTLALSASAVTLGASQATTTISIINYFTSYSAFIGGSDNHALFTSTPKYQGLDYNNVSVYFGDASNGNSAYFNMYVVHAQEPSLNETYVNLTITGNPTVAESTFLDKAKAASQLMDFAYLDLSATTGQQIPKFFTYYYSGGLNGTSPVALDYVGDQAGQNGFNSFDTVDDALQFAAPELSDNTVHIAGGAYAQLRQDMMYIAHLDNSSTTAAAYCTARQATNIDSYFTMFTAGGLSITDPVNGLPKDISEVGDVLGIMAFNDNKEGPWAQPAGLNRGIIGNVLGVVNNFGSGGLYNSLNQMVNQQINLVVNQNGQVYLNSANTAIFSSSKLSFVATVRYLLWLKKILAPTLKRYLQEPGDIPKFKALYQEVKPFMDNQVSIGAIVQYSWQGDQDAKDLQHLVINNTNELDQGKYKVKLFLDKASPMQQIEVDLTVTASNVTLS